jgi:ankyrin repeat protein
MAYLSNLLRKWHAADGDPPDKAPEAPERDWSSHKSYDNTTARDQSRQHNGDHYANINIYNGATATKSAPGPDAKAALERLMFDEMEARYLTINASLAPRSCRWLFDREDYRRWQDIRLIAEHRGFLWIKGKAGAGKSTLMKYAFDAAEHSRVTGQTVVSFFFNARGASIERSLEGMYRALLYQVLHKLPQLRYLLSKRRAYSAQNHVWSINWLQQMFQDVIESLGSERLTCYVDALDECTEDDIQEMVSFFEDLCEHSAEKGIQLYVCFASRHYPYISIDRSVSLVLEDQDGHKEDISKYVQKKLKISNDLLKEEISAQLEDRASGIFLWIVLVVKILNDECKRGNVQLIRTRLKDIPTGLTDLIQDILQRDKPTKYLVPLLQFILYSRRPLAREELFLALQSLSVETIHDSHRPEALTHDNIDKFILNTSKGLVEMTKGKQPRVQFIHELVRAHFLGAEGLAKLDPGLATNVAGQSHDQLKKCCQNYLVSEICAHVPLPTRLPKAESDEGKALRSQTNMALPFLQYTLDNIWYHANAAHAQGITQRGFISFFPFAIWRNLGNVVASYTSHRHHETVSTAYILAERGCVFLLEIVMESLPQADAPNERCSSVLGAAIESRDVQSVRAVLKHDGYEHSLGKGKRVCMALAIQIDELEMVHALTEAHAKPYNPKVEVTNNNALVLAASSPDKFGPSPGRFGLLRLVTDSLSSADRANKFCVMALEGALLEVCKLGDLGMFRLLCGKGVRPTGEMLRQVCHRRNEVLVRAILEAGIDGGANEASDDALTVAASKGEENIVRLLLHEGAYLYTENGPRSGNAGLVEASWKGHEAVVRLLLEHGAEVEARDRYEQSGLQAACHFGHIAIVRLLIQSGANLNDKAKTARAKARFGFVHALNTPLFEAILGRHSDIARLLIEEGADIHCVSSEGRTALWAACDAGIDSIVRLLVERGAAINLRDYTVYSALSVAKEHGYTEIVDLIKGKSAA